MSTTESALRVHLVVSAAYPGDAFMADVTETLDTRFEIHHSTLQNEQGTTAQACRLHPEWAPAPTA